MAEDVYWAGSRSEADKCPALKGRASADVVIVGGGYTGLSAALTLAEEGRSVILLEAVEPGAGASGRNAGHVVPFWARRTPKDTRRMFGTDMGERMCRMVARSAAGVFNLIDRYGMSVDAKPGGHLSLVSTKGGLAKGRQLAAEWRAAGAKVRDLTSEEAADFVTTDRAVGGWLFEEGGYVNPMDYARGLALAVTEAGARIHGHSPARRIRQEGGKWSVETEQGRVEATHLIMATNAYEGGLWPGLQKAGYALTCGMLASEPISTGTVFKWPGPWAWADDRTLASGAMDGGGALTMSVLPGPGKGGMARLSPIADAVLSRYFPALPPVRWVHHWSGRLLATPDGFPRLIELGPRAYAAFGYNGNGIAIATAYGREVANAVLGRDMSVPVGGLKKAPLSALFPWLVRNVMTPLARAF
jgi:glycine/D-amino acid oxidase-like deaminating enzyme